MIGVFWKRESRPIERHQCHLLPRGLFFCFQIYSLCSYLGAFWYKAIINSRESGFTECRYELLWTWFDKWRAWYRPPNQSFYQLVRWLQLFAAQLILRVSSASVLLLKIISRSPNEEVMVVDGSTDGVQFVIEWTRWVSWPWSWNFVASKETCSPSAHGWVIGQVQSNRLDGGGRTKLGCGMFARFLSGLFFFFLTRGPY
jgi:hypothetical protein